MNDLQLAVEGAKIAVGLLLFWLAVCAYGKAALADWRQELFSTRNRLWDRMREVGALDEPAHRELRGRINALLRWGPTLNVMTAFFLLMLPRRVMAPRADAPLPTDPAAAAAIKAAHAAVARALIRRVMLDTFPGVFLGLPLIAVWEVRRRLRPTTTAVGRASLLAGSSVQAVRASLATWADEVEWRAVRAERGGRVCASAA